MDNFLLIIGALLQVLGLVGSVLPALAGPPFNFLGLILLCLAKGWDVFTPAFLFSMAGLTILSVVLDYVLPIRGAKKYGSSKWGAWGAFLGMLVGLLFFPPLGLIIGAFAGAVIAELLAGKENEKALKAGWGVFLGFFASLLIKLIASGLMTFFYFKALF
ncbi:MAG: DUF456 domain-containing protein [Acidobacteriota bacterium]|nr:DUF456 domain-containing protein [Acidobacteriota bacterium]MDW3228667.1 DUF456 domain-containing protein [Acidobacteriota bacterium]MDY0231038.1 DUF456 domain-containing protein [Candidatus Saccharicenans sp.]